MARSLARFGWIFYVTVTAAVLTSPVWLAMAGNELRAYRLLWNLASTELPNGATYTTYRARVANLGNSDGCDYEATVLIAFDGNIDELARRFVMALHSFPHEEIYQAPGTRPGYWGAKAVPGGPELAIRQTASAPKEYEIILTSTPRLVSPDVRCW